MVWNVFGSVWLNKSTIQSNWKLTRLAGVLSRCTPAACNISSPKLVFSSSVTLDSMLLACPEDPLVSASISLSVASISDRHGYIRPALGGDRRILRTSLIPGYCLTGDGAFLVGDTVGDVTGGIGGGGGGVCNGKNHQWNNTPNIKLFLYSYLGM